MQPEAHSPEFAVLPDDLPLGTWYVLTLFSTYYRVLDQDEVGAMRQVVELHQLDPSLILGAFTDLPPGYTNALF